MERAERLVLLGVGLAFDILVPMLWIMLVLTAFTAVQRFVKVWRQATPERPRRARVTAAARAPRSRAPAAWRSGGRRTVRRPSARRGSRVRAASSLTHVRDPRRRSLPARTSYLAYRAGAERRAGRPRSDRRAAGARRSRSSRSRCMPARRAQVERNLRRVHGGRLRRRRARGATSPPPSTRTAATGYELFRLPTDRPTWIEAHFDVDGYRARRGRARRGQRRDPRAAAPRQLGLRRRVARASRASPSPWSPSRSSRPSCSSGSSRRARALGHATSMPLVAVGAAPSVLAGAARQRGRVPPRATATSPATASRSSSSASARRCPAARRCSRCGRARRCSRPGATSGPTATARGRIRPPVTRRARRPAPRRRRPGHPGPRPRASRS